MRRAILISLAVCALGGCGGTSKHPSTTSGARPPSSAPTTAAPSPTTTGAKCNFTVDLRAPNHHPVVNRNWTITVTLHPSNLVGKPSYQFLLNGSTLVSTQYVNGNRNFTFRGHYTDPQKFPPSAVGFNLTFRVVVATRCGTQHADYPIVVRQ